MTFFSVIIPTIGRQKLARAAQSVLSQELPPDTLELIVVNDSGRPLPPAAWQKSEQAQIITTQRQERCVARNTGAAVAQGRYLLFLDDDDWLLPRALGRLLQTAATTKAEFIYGRTQLVDRKGNPLLILQPDIDSHCFTQLMSGEWIPLQSAIIRADAFAAVGGFNPLVIGGEDIDLLRRLAYRYRFTPVAGVIACVEMGRAGSTTNYAQGRQQARQAKDRLLDWPAAGKRLRQSAGSAYWRGRVVHLYLASAYLNLTRKRFFLFGSRMAQAVFHTATAVTSLLSPAFWQAVFTSHQSRAFTPHLQTAGAPGKTAGEKCQTVKEAP